MIHERLEVVPQSAAELDDITAFLPGISAKEYRDRACLRSWLNHSAKALERVPQGTARNLFICLRDHCFEWYLRGASPADLREAAALAVMIATAASIAEGWEGRVDDR